MRSTFCNWMPHDAPCREQHLPCAAGQKPASTHRATVKVGPLRCMLRIVETSGTKGSSYNDIEFLNFRSTTLMVQPSTPSTWGPWNLRLHCSSKLLAHCGFTANVPPARSSLIRLLESWMKQQQNLKTKNGMKNECLDSGYSSSMLNRFVEYLGQVWNPPSLEPHAIRLELTCAIDFCVTGPKQWPVFGWISRSFLRKYPWFVCHNIYRPHFTSISKEKKLRICKCYKLEPFKIKSIKRSVLMR